MKKTFVLLLFLLIVPIQFMFAQFLGGGSGTESDPYRIYTIEHWNEFATEYNDSLSVYGDFSGIHLRLMDDITDTITTRVVGYLGIDGAWPSYKSFNGYMHGGGHLLTLSMPVSGTTAENEHLMNPPYFWWNIGGNGIVDSINFVGKILSYQNMTSIFNSNEGRISGCVSDLDCSTYRPEDWYEGFVAENSGTIEYCRNYTEIPMGSFIGICMNNEYPGVVTHCVNYANMPNKEESMSSGIVMENWSVVEYCMNVGNMPYMQYETAGIVLQSYHQVYQSYDYENHVMVVDSIVRGVVQNCINVGDLYMENGAACGTAAIVVGEVDGSIVRNCLNVGKSAGSFDTYMVGYENTLVNPAMFHVAERDFTIENCLNVGNTVGGLLNKVAAVTADESYVYDNIYYDKQMCRSLDKTLFEISNGVGYDYTIDSIEHGRLTSQLVGDTPELRAMLGDGWSYAEGRYPVPLGFENDSIALRAATPIFLHAESDDDYEHIDSVASHFSVSIANGAQWLATSGKIDIVGENATLLHLGRETLKTNLGDIYEKNITLNIVNVPVVAENIDLQDIDIFPNPVTDILNITSSEPISEIEIVNVMGQVVKRIEVNGDNAICDVEDLKAGVYVVKVSRITGEVEDLKLVKKTCWLN